MVEGSGYRKAIHLYEFTYKQKSFTFPTEGEWQSAREVEGIIHCANPIVLFSQSETKLLGAYGPAGPSGDLFFARIEDMIVRTKSS